MPQQPVRDRKRIGNNGSNAALIDHETMVVESCHAER